MKKKYYIAHVAVLILAEDEGEAADAMSATLSNPDNESIADWQYDKDDFFGGLKKADGNRASRSIRS